MLAAVFKHASLHLYTLSGQEASSAAGLGMGVGRAIDHSFYTCPQNGLGTSRSATLVVAGFQVNIKTGTLSCRTRLGQGQDFRVGPARLAMDALPHHPAFSDHHRPHCRVGRSGPLGLGAQGQGAGHKFFVFAHPRRSHDFYSSLKCLTAKITKLFLLFFYIKIASAKSVMLAEQLNFSKLNRSNSSAGRQ
jgi:hypothetical protein